MSLDLSICCKCCLTVRGNEPDFALHAIPYIKEVGLIHCPVEDKDNLADIKMDPPVWCLHKLEQAIADTKRRERRAAVQS
jgi:hypothetical protein